MQALVLTPSLLNPYPIDMYRVLLHLPNGPHIRLPNLLPPHKPLPLLRALIPSHLLRPIRRLVLRHCRWTSALSVEVASC